MVAISKIIIYVKLISIKLMCKMNILRDFFMKAKKIILFLICLIIQANLISEIECAAAKEDSEAKQKLDYIVVSFSKDMETYLKAHQEPHSWAVLIFHMISGGHSDMYYFDLCGERDPLVKSEKIYMSDEYISYKIKIMKESYKSCIMYGPFSDKYAVYITPGYRYFYSGCLDTEGNVCEKIKGIERFLAPKLVAIHDLNGKDCPLRDHEMPLSKHGIKEIELEIAQALQSIE